MTQPKSIVALHLTLQQYDIVERRAAEAGVTLGGVVKQALALQWPDFELDPETLKRPPPKLRNISVPKKIDSRKVAADRLRAMRDGG